jgi:hypothetical protein
MHMLISSFFIWWYGDGWKQVVKSIKIRTMSISASFSVNSLIRTWFAPWKRIISYTGDGFDDKIRASLDNLFSRAVGFVVRSIVLLAALVTIIFVAVLSLIEIIVWPLLPALVPVSIILGIIL